MYFVHQKGVLNKPCAMYIMKYNTDAFIYTCDGAVKNILTDSE